jgi:hypothetical protein
MVRIAPATTRFTRGGSLPILSGAVAWENGACGEPTLIYEGGVLKMWYFGGWGAAAIGYATCSGDPTVPGNWTKYAGNPVLGQGGSGLATAAARPCIVKDGSTYYMYFSDGGVTSDLFLSTSSDGITWGAPATVLTHSSPAHILSWQNSMIWKQATGDWRMLVDAGKTTVIGRNAWVMNYATATAAAGPWTVQGSGILSTTHVDQFPLGIGRPCYLGLSGGLHRMTYHVSYGNYSTVWYAASADLVNWLPSDQAVMWPNYGVYEGQQLSDQRVIEVDGTTYMFYTGINNGLAAAYINAAKYPGPLAEFIRWKDKHSNAFGRTNIATGAAGANPADTLLVNQHTAPEDGHCTGGRAYLSGGSAGGPVRFVMHADTGGDLPGAFVAASGEVTLAANQPADWLAFTFASPPAVTAGTKYWFGIWNKSTNGSNRYLDGLPDNYAAKVLKYNTGATYSAGGNPPDPFGTHSSAADQNTSWYATFTA